MISKHRIDYFEFERLKDVVQDGGKINIKLTAMKAKDKEIEIDYEFSIQYNEKSGRMQINGKIIAEYPEPKKVVEDWKKTRKLPDDLSAELLNEIANYNRIRAAGVMRALHAKIEPVTETKQEKNRPAA